MNSDVLALSAIVLWSSLAALGVSLVHVPPFFLIGSSLLIGSLIALPLSGFRLAAWRIPPKTLALGVYGLFGYHLLLFIGLRTAPAVEANLVNYLWPLGIVVLSPVMLPGIKLRPAHVGAALLGFGGAAVAILGRDPDADGRLASGFYSGYVFAFAAAFVWATYSLGTRRVAAFETAAVGSFAALSGALALTCHALFEPPVSLSASDVLRIAVLGMGPLGGAFFLWDAAIKRGDPRRIGLLAFLTPLLSTMVILLATGQPFRPHVLVSAVMIIGAAMWGRSASQA